MPKPIYPDVPPFDEDEGYRVLNEGLVDVECPACGDYTTIEPDADYLCQCKEGCLVSPLVLWGMI